MYLTVMNKCHNEKKKNFTIIRQINFSFCSRFCSKCDPDKMLLSCPQQTPIAVKVKPIK